jgi:hypothetical protein
MTNLWAHVIGYLFAVVVGDWLIKKLSAALWVALGVHRPSPWHPRLVGIIERLLYVIALEVDCCEFLGFWLAIKVAGQWSRWTEGHEGVSGREFFNTFLIGNGVSILFAITGFKMVQWWANDETLAFISAPLGLVLLTYGLIVFALKQKKVD